MLNLNEKIIADEYTYRTVQFLGSGGNSQTYHVIRTGEPGNREDPLSHGVGANYALKLAHDDLSDERSERFEIERDFLKNTDHPAILPYHDEGNYSGDPFIVVEYLPDTLEEIILSDQVTMSEKLNYALQLTSALAHLHNLDDPVIHRDIKPSNIFVRQNTAFLGDFGLMKRQSTDSDEDSVEVTKESNEEAFVYRYPTPDIIEYEKGGELTPSSDIFQLGLVLIKLFTTNNQNPVEDVEQRGRFEPIVTEEIQNIPGTEVSREASNILHKMIKLDPDERPTAGELIPEWKELLNEAAQKERRLNGRAL